MSLFDAQTEAESRATVSLWLDDVRPAPVGWVHARTVDEARPLLEAGVVLRASLDHDLGACEACMAQWREDPPVDAMPNCEHVGTGYTLCLWMAETGHWPHRRPDVHSMNPVGRERMRGVIARYWRQPG